MKTSNENEEKYQLWDYYLIQYQILQTNMMRIIWQTVKRINNEILGVKGFRQQLAVTVLQNSKVFFTPLKYVVVISLHIKY